MQKYKHSQHFVSSADVTQKRDGTSEMQIGGPNLNLTHKYQFPSPEAQFSLLSLILISSTFDNNMTLYNIQDLSFSFPQYLGREEVWSYIPRLIYLSMSLYGYCVFFSCHSNTYGYCEIYVLYTNESTNQLGYTHSSIK